MNLKHRLMAGALATLAAGAVVLGQAQSVVDSPHNLSASGPGAIRAASEQRVCIFCHTAHGASPVQPLWNRQAPITGYTVYASSSLDARPGQPTGASKMCLSCHDGSIALGSVLSEGQVIQMAGGITTLPPGTSNLGSDLSDDHPISFAYDTLLTSLDRRLRDPNALPEEVRLDRNGELQCIACHEPHDNSFGQFLVMDNTNSVLCVSCHRISSTTITEHQSCLGCHRSHSAPSGPYLLTGLSATESCLSCHDGSTLGAEDIAAEMHRYSVHDNSTVGFGDEAIPHWQQTTCTSCHEPHTMDPGGGATGLSLPSNLGRIAGMTVSGSQVEMASQEYEVCFRCHADTAVGRRPLVSRQIVETNTRMEFDPAAISYHPVAAPGKNPDVPSLKPTWTPSSTMSCSDCHGSDTSRKAGGSGPNGVHGSNEPPLLLARYELADYTPESASSYALCYRCHDREGTDGILSDRSFPHRLHVSSSRAPCSVCHDPHGVSSAQGTRINNSHLINFNLRVVFPNDLNGQLEYRDTGVFSGSCTLTCHGFGHVNTTYRGGNVFDLLDR